MAVWTVTYNNDTGPNDEGYFEWWDISDGNVTFRANDQHSAQWLCDQLNLQKEEAAEIERLRAALRPFAKAADGFDMQRISNPEEWFAYGGIRGNHETVGAITVGDLRRARAALEEDRT